jgi:hypothetical protein
MPAIPYVDTRKTSTKVHTCTKPLLVTWSKHRVIISFIIYGWQICAQQTELHQRADRWVPQLSQIHSSNIHWNTRSTVRNQSPKVPLMTDAMITLPKDLPYIYPLAKVVMNLSPEKRGWSMDVGIPSPLVQSGQTCHPSCWWKFGASTQVMTAHYMNVTEWSAANSSDYIKQKCTEQQILKNKF